MLFTSRLSSKDTICLKEYESFVQGHKNGSFYQSLAWTKVKDNWKSEVILVRNHAGELVGSALVLIQKLPFFHKTLLYSPRGPVCDYEDCAVLEAILQEIRRLAAEYNGCLFRTDPCIAETSEAEIRFFERAGFHYYMRQAEDYTTVQTRNNYVLDIRGKSADEVFAGFHSKWRYNIRLAERKGVQCVVGSKDNLDDFCLLMEETGARDGFQTRPKEYFEKLMDSYGEHCRLYLCYKDGIPLSGALTIQYAGKTCYVYGASSNENRNLMPNSLMQWTMIQWAIASGCHLYDFMGIPYYFDEKHPNYGVYRFKKGFNGRVLAYAGEFDFLFQPVTAKLLQWYLSKGRKAMKKIPRRAG